MDKISIILATKNREAILWQTVENALLATEGKPAELIIVNDGDENISVPAHIKNRIRLFKNPSKGVSSARNFGASMAENDLLFFIDDDMWITAEGVDWILKFMQNDSNRNAVYNLNWEYPASLNTKLQSSKIGRFILSNNYHRMWGRMKVEGPEPAKGLYKFNAIASCSLLMDKDLFNALGKYKEDFIFQGEDIELSRRINEKGVPIYAVFDVTLFHNHQDRMEIKGYLARLQQGYQSEFAARAKGLLPNVDEQFKGKEKILSVLKTTEPFWIMLHKIIPGISIFNKFNTRLVGMLSGLQRFKQWKNNA